MLAIVELEFAAVAHCWLYLGLACITLLSTRGDSCITLLDELHVGMPCTEFCGIDK